MPIDKPIVSIQAAQKAAADANALAQAAQEAAGVVNSIPGATPTKTWVLRILGAVGVVGATAATALTAGTLPAFIAGAASVATYIAGLCQPSPAAVDKFGQGVAK